eukprot:scaffold112077_cov32-Tisochrysis_lutea.AAC.5
MKVALPLPSAPPITRVLGPSSRRAQPRHEPPTPTGTRRCGKRFHGSTTVRGHVQAKRVEAVIAAGAAQRDDARRGRRGASGELMLNYLLAEWSQHKPRLATEPRVTASCNLVSSRAAISFRSDAPAAAKSERVATRR